MIGGISGGYPVLVPADRGSDRRERTGDVFLRTPTETPARRPDQADQQQPRTGREPAGSSLFQQRVEPRAQAQAARLERDDLSAMPRQSQKALQTYGEIAANREDFGVDLVGLDLRV